MSNYSSTIDLAGQIYSVPNYFQIQKRINYLVDDYLSFKKLCDRLQDLPIQFNNPQPRSWKTIEWSAINSEQILGIEPKVFFTILIGIINTEAPIRSYTQTSRQYLAKIHPQLARFVGGIVAEDGTILELGLWEKEERQHAPALIKIYQHLTEEKIIPQPRQVKTYQPSDNPYEDLYLHGFHRVMTEYGATCLYLWLMAHTTGTLQQVFVELLQDEINHMTKFWGFGVWAYPESYFLRMLRSRSVSFGESLTHLRTLKTTNQIQFTKKLARTLCRMMEILNWNDWSWVNKAEFIYTCIHVIHHLLRWDSTLKREYLEDLFGESLMVCPRIESPVNY